MPNWTTTTLRLTGERTVMQPVLDAIATEDPGVPVFDFDKILAVPEELKQTSSGVQIDPDQQVPVKYRTDHRTGKKTAHTISIEENERRMQAYGANTWYLWAQDNWGVTQNASSVEVAEDISDDPDHPEVIVAFQTPWNAPKGIIAVLRERGVEVIGGCIHEDGSTFENLSDPEELFYSHFRVESETITEEYEHDGESYTSEHTWNRIEPLIHS